MKTRLQVPRQHMLKRRIALNAVLVASSLLLASCGLGEQDDDPGRRGGPTPVGYVVVEPESKWEKWVEGLKEKVPTPLMVSVKQDTETNPEPLERVEAE